MMVTSKKTKVRLVLSTIIFMLVFVGVVFGFALVFGILKTQNEQKFDQSVVATGQAVSGEATDP
ncbi:MAG TPA: hypothetical protein DCP06_05250 [Lachnospiraceae bacterium]|nr:hypothetical protein [Eubacterium sp.]HAK58367.1 hypothetical protein [Lachnospiraceae bacterium]